METDEIYLEMEITKFSESEWTRTGDRLIDDLTLYTKGYFFDCSFTVSSVDSKQPPKIFRCHKIILARASSVFASMLFGHFQESTRSKEEPIKISGVHPVAFELAMRYIYGGQADFLNVRFACDVYKFAHEWQIDDLLKAAGTYFDVLEPEDALPVYETFRFLNDDPKAGEVLTLIEENTSAVLTSNYWPQVAAGTVLEIFQSDRLRIVSELELFDALIKWGSADRDAAEDNAALRTKIKEALKLIRFCTLSTFEFAELCKKTDIFTYNEKYLILLSIEMAGESHMPPDFSSSRKFRNLDGKIRYRPCFQSQESKDPYFVNCNTPPSVFTFAVKSDGFCLTGVQLSSVSYSNKGKELDLKCFVTSACSPKALTSVSVKALNDYSGEDWIKFPNEVLLKKNIFYTITVRYNQKDAQTTRRYQYRQNLTWFDDNKFELVFPCVQNTHQDVLALDLIYMDIPQAEGDHEDRIDVV